MIDRLRKERNLPDSALKTLLESPDASLQQELLAAAREVRDAHVGHTVRLRGLVEVSNGCRNDCLYCGIRRSNGGLPRYTLEIPDILAACEKACRKGIRTFVLQGGENPQLVSRWSAAVRGLRAAFPDAVVTLSLGELPYADYAALREAGAGRYLLRHESANPAHYARLHPKGRSLEDRLACARELRRLGFEVGLGMMIGSPFQTTDDLVADLRLLQSFRPEMVGCGPFIPHPSTPFADYPAGSADTTLRLYALIRLLLPAANIPSTTALSVLLHNSASAEQDSVRWVNKSPAGDRPGPGFCGSKIVEGAKAAGGSGESYSPVINSAMAGIEAGANVLMPNFTPKEVREGYDLYAGKTGADTDFEKLTTELKRYGYNYV